jgi:hypothetical protein
MVGTSGVRRRFIGTVAGMISWGLIAAIFTAITIALNYPSVVKDSTGAPGWLYVLDLSPHCAPS